MTNHAGLQVMEYLQRWGFVYPLKTREKQNEKLEVLTADDLNLHSKQNGKPTEYPDFFFLAVLC